VILYKKVRDEYNLIPEANEILLSALDSLTDLMRCSDGSKEEKNAAFDLLKGTRIDLKTLFNMDIPFSRKLKFVTYSLFGAKFHCKLIAMMHKKLC
jgi:hypothetical protein